MRSREEKRGTLLVFISAVLFSLGGLCMKMIPWSPMAINGARCILSVVINYAFLRLTGRRLKLNRWILLGAAFVFLTNALFAVANKLTTAANAIVHQFTAPVFTVFLAWAFLRARPKRLTSSPVRSCSSASYAFSSTASRPAACSETP